MSFDFPSGKVLDKFRVFFYPILSPDLNHWQFARD